MRVFTLPKRSAVPKLRLVGAASGRSSSAQPNIASTPREEPPLDPACEITDPAALIGEKDWTPEEMLSAITKSERSLDHFNRKELIGLAKHLGAKDDDCRGKPVKAMRELNSQLITAFGEAPEESEESEEEAEKLAPPPKVVNYVHLPRRLA